MSLLAQLATEHLLLRLQPLERALRAAVQRQSEAAARLERPDLNELCVTNEHVRLLLDEAAALLANPQYSGRSATPLTAELEAEARVRAQAAAAGLTLPLDRLVSALRLTPFEVEALVLCAAPEIDRAYERIFAFILDDLQRRAPCVELLATLTAASPAESCARRVELGRLGRLRRLGLLRTWGEAATEGRQELRLGVGVLDVLLGAADTVGLFADPGEVAILANPQVPADIDAAAIERLGGAIDLGLILTVGIWGARGSVHDDVVMALATAAKRPLRRLVVPAGDVDPAPAVRDALEIAAIDSALLWVPAERLSASGGERLAEALVELLPRSDVPVCLSAAHPWRPSALLAARPYAELTLPLPSFRARKAMWRALVPELSDEAASDRAARLRVGPAEIRAIAEVARAGVRLSSSSDAPATVQELLDDACATVMRKRADHVARVTMPTRSEDDLVLPSELHRQVLEVAHFFRAWPRVAEEWSLGRTLASNRGVKALFTGDPGTGKTLAAEVIAGVIGLPLFKVDLAQVISKWVGETEKNLDAVFREAEDSHSVLFFDEADALFGKRGEVQHGTDRYANLEVSYLLQRLEDYEGLVILASNLKDNIDTAFTRRFQVVLHFPRPRFEERLRIWHNALPPGAPAAAEVDLELLAKLELTGAGIVNAVRTGALLAAHAGSASIGMLHLIEGVARQYRREARVLTPGELGRFRGLVGVTT